MIAQIPSSFANSIAPYATLGRQAVGQENTELKISTLKPLEQSADSARASNRRSPEDRPNEVGEQERVREGRRESGQDSEQREADKKAQLEIERSVISELAARDREVRAHEQAHAAVGGQYASSPTYEYERGPDGVSYAVSGEVSISTGAVPGDPEATILKAQQIRRAANAPADPSPQDRRVAAAATGLEVEARAELRRQDALEVAQQAEQAEREDALRAEKEEEIEAREKAEAQLKRSAESSEKTTDTAPDVQESAVRNIDVSRRLSDIGVFSSASPLGRFVNRTA
jgi:hypothetical protein